MEQSPRRRGSAPTRRSRRSSSTGFNVAIIGITLILFVAVLFGLDALINIGRIRPNVEIANTKVGFKTKKKATTALDSAFNKAYARSVDLSYEDSLWSFDSEQLGLSYDPQKHVDEAFSVGRRGSIFKRMGERVSSYFKKTEITALPDYDKAKLKQSLSKVKATINKPAVQSSVKLEGTKYIALPGSAGKLLNEKKLLSLLSDSLLSAKAQIKAPVDTDKLIISKEEAQAAADFASKVLVTEPSISNKDKSLILDQENFSTILTFKNSDEAEGNSFKAYDFEPKQAEGAYLKVGLFIPELDTRVVKPLNGEIEVEATPARFDVEKGEVVVIPEKAGKGHSASELAKDLVKSKDKKNQKFKLKVGEVWPSLTTDVAKSYGINEQLSTYTLNFEKADPQSAVNIKLSADYLDGHLIAPNETFSFNEALGKRTFERGFVEAPGIVGGKLVPDLGGGICLTSSTIFNTVLYSGLPVQDRINHSFKLPSYPDGQDAAVSWGAPDFKFKNDTGRWLLLDSSYTDKDVTFALYGTSANYDVDISVGEWKNLKDYPKETVTTDILNKGEVKILQEGAQGGQITVTRTVKQGDKIVRTDDFRSNYRPRPEITGIGK